MNCNEIKENTEFWKNLNHNYLVIRCEESRESYETEMLKKNSIGYLLNTETRAREGREDLCYEISSLQPISRIYTSGMLGYEDLKIILAGIPKVYETARKYMLDPEKILLDPELIYMDMETKDLKFVYFPFYDEAESIKFSNFSEYLLQVINHLDSDAVYLGYRFYKLVRRENLVMRELVDLLNQPAQEKEDKGLDYNECDAERKEAEDTDFWEEEMKVHGSGQQSRGEKESGHQQKRILQGWKTYLFGPALIVLPMLCLVFGWIRFKKNMKMGIIALALIGIGIFWTVNNIRKAKVLKGERSLKRDDEREPVNEAEGWSSPDRETWSEEIISPAISVSEEEQEEDYGKTVFMEAVETDRRRVLIEKKRGKEHVISKLPLSIGKVKESVDIVLSDKSVSRLHAQIFQKEKEIYIRDCNSTNGTRVNGLLLNAEEVMVLEDEDEVMIGNVCLIYRDR